MEKYLDMLLKDGAAQFGVQLSEEKLSAFTVYKELLLEWNQKINLTAIEEDKDVVLKHFVDSLSIIPFLNNSKTLIDVGTGAGFPGLPVKIAKPDLEVVLLDSLEKRVGFLNRVINELNMEKITALHSRAEDAGNSPKYREQFDAVTARAVAALPVLLEYCMPLVRTGGIFIAMKGSSISDTDEAGKALNILGGTIEEVKEFYLPGSDMKRNIIVIRKLRQTPTKYPRKAGKPSKEPLI